MKVKVSDFIADYFANHGIKDIFTVVGGGAMHLNYSFGRHPKLHCIYNHHEQASSMAAEAYYRVNNQMAGLCVTSGPGAINALNGVAGAYQDSIPMIVISGQCKRALTTRYTKVDVRTLGPQEFDIISALKYFVKYSESVMDANDILYCLEKAFYLALNGRPGPCWLEIPIDIQSSIIETDNLRHFDPNSFQDRFIESDLSSIDIVLEKLKTAKRPVIYAGNGIRIAKAVDSLHKLINKVKIPVVACWDSIDVVESDNQFYVGRAGTMGDRPGNFAIQNSDLLIVIGSRLNTYQVGYLKESWAREAFVVVVDIDKKELKKPTIRVDLPICADAKDFIETLYQKADEIYDYSDWLNKCTLWKNKYSVVSEKQKQQETPVNVYALIDVLSRKLPDNMITVVANGSASVVGSAAYHINKGNRFIMNCGISSMGYDLPAAIGACVANNNQDVLCIAGDGSIQMNIQELQTIVTNKLPIKIVVINNEGYQQIRLSQKNFFKGDFVGLGPDSHDLSFPDFSKLSYAYGIPYMYCEHKNELIESIDWLLKQNSYCMLEVHCDTKQVFEPKSSAKQLKDGSMYSPPLEDLSPFLSREEMEENMCIPLWGEKDE